MINTLLTLSLSLVTALPIIWAGIQIYEKLILPKLTVTKLKKLYYMIEDWYDEIDVNFDKVLNNDQLFNKDLLFNKEKKIDAYIRDSGLKNHQLQFTLQFKGKFLKFCGIKQELRDNNELFSKYSRFRVDDPYVDLFWNTIRANFYKNYHLWKDNEDANANNGDFEMPIKLLKMYLNIKE
jgi:hypothetical protein